MKKLILASKSIDRSEIFKRSKIPFEIFVTNVDEEKFKTKYSNPIELVKELAKAKAKSAQKSFSTKIKEAIIVAADTVVEFNGEIIGKAKDEQQAFLILKKLAGNTHHLITGIAITKTNSRKIIIDYDITSVKFLNLTNEEILSYINSDEWKGRAGAYSMREKASIFIESIEGSSSNVIGLPMHKIYKILKFEFNLNLLRLT
ncbi:MAG: nucleoside triphosphate pyrophosphatase [Promethearchaeota archaeon]